MLMPLTRDLLAIARVYVSYLKIPAFLSMGKEKWSKIQTDASLLPKCPPLVKKLNVVADSVDVLRPRHR